MTFTQDAFDYYSACLAAAYIQKYGSSFYLSESDNNDFLTWIEPSDNANSVLADTNLDIQPLIDSYYQETSIDPEQCVLCYNPTEAGWYYQNKKPSLEMSTVQ